MYAKKCYVRLGTLMSLNRTIYVLPVYFYLMVSNVFHAYEYISKQYTDRNILNDYKKPIVRSSVCKIPK